MYVLTDRRHPVASIDWNWDRSEVGGWFLGGAQPQNPDRAGSQPAVHPE
ncbi:MAG: hypothetical protein H6816_00355 [Phycisphaerales bacterium]|nr:hypothetical protein [Phycisphaerales bacterium]